MDTIYEELDGIGKYKQSEDDEISKDGDIELNVVNNLDGGDMIKEVPNSVKDGTDTINPMRITAIQDDEKHIPQEQENEDPDVPRKTESFVFLWW